MIGYGAMARGLVSLAVVIGLLVVFVLVLRRGARGLGPFRSRAAILVETATSLGERRSLVIVAVEGRRLLLGLSPGSVSLLTELAAAPAPDATPAGADPRGAA